MSTTAPIRNYDAIRLPAARQQHAILRELTDSLWDALADTGVSWIGFYLGPGQQTEDGRTVGPSEMLLGPCRNKPACSPIGLHGVCGRGWTEQRSIIVRDVAVLGPNYVACDPRDRSEVVVPMFDPAGRCWGVLDADSFDLGAFAEKDAAAIADLLHRAGVTSIPAARIPVVSV